MYVSLSNGTGFGPSAKWNDWFAISADERVVIGDYDGDGRDDIATWLPKSTHQVYVALSRGTGMTTASVWLDALGTDDSDLLQAGDVNGDGRKDLVLFARKQGKVYVALSNGTRFEDQDGVASSSTKWHDWFAIDPDEDVQVGDQNGDGKDDFFTFLPPARGGQCYTVASLGAAMAPSVLAPYLVRLDARDRVFVGDVDGDRKADVIVFAQGVGKVYVAISK